MSKKKIKDLTFFEIMKIHNTTPCNDCPLKDEEGNCIRSGTHYNFSDEFLNREVVVEDSLEVEEKEVFKEFEELGYEIYVIEDQVYLKNTIIRKEIYIFTTEKEYQCIKRDVRGTVANITFQEHQLLHRLFEIWGWFDE